MLHSAGYIFFSIIICFIKNFYPEIYMQIKNKSTLIISILIPLAVGTVSAFLSGTMMMPYTDFNKPPLSPPAILFPIVWTILYILMGISSYIVYESDSPEKKGALKTYALQLFFNFLWSIVFFRFHLYLFAFIWLLALIAIIAVMIYRFYKIEPVSAYLQIPYLLWCIFAAYLNYMIYLLN